MSNIEATLENTKNDWETRVTAVSKFVTILSFRVRKKCQVDNSRGAWRSWKLEINLQNSITSD